MTCKEIEAFYNSFENDDDFGHTIKVLSETVHLDAQPLKHEMYSSNEKGILELTEYMEKYYPKAYLFFRNQTAKSFYP